MEQMRPKFVVDTNATPSGPNATNGISLSEITTIDQSLLRFIGQNNSDSTRVHEEAHISTRKCPEELAQRLQLRPNEEKLGSKSRKRGPMEVTQQLQARPNEEYSYKKSPKEISPRLKMQPEAAKPMLSMEKQLEKLRKENLQLKLELLYSGHRDNHESVQEHETTVEPKVNSNSSDSDARNGELARQPTVVVPNNHANSDPKEQVMLKDAQCQTNLTVMHIHEIFRSVITLKKERQQLQDQLKLKAQANEQTNQIDKREHPVKSLSHTSALNTIAPIESNQHLGPSRQLFSDERHILEDIYKLDGDLTTVLDKLKAKLQAESTR